MVYQTNNFIRGDKFTELVNSGIPFEEAKKQAISIDSLGSTPNLIKLPTQNTPTNITLPTGINTSGQNLTEGQLKEQTPPKTNYEDLFKQYITGQTTLPSQEEAYTKARETAGMQTKQEQVNLYQGQLNQINEEARQAQLLLEQQAGGKDVTTGFLGKQQQEITRQSAIKALPISAQLASAQGDLLTAQSNLETLFKVKSEDATNQYNYLKEQRKSVFDFATTQQKNKLEQQQKIDDRKETLNKENSKIAQDWAKIAMESGQPNIMAQISNLDTSSLTFSNQLSVLQKQIKVSPTQQLDILLKQEQIKKIRKETALLGEQTAKEKKDEALALKTASGQIDVLREKVNLIDSILGSKGMSSRVGTSFLSRIPTGENFWGTIGKGIGWGTKIPLTLGIGTYKDIATGITGEGQQFAGGVHKLASREFLDTLIQAKQSGATFGSLTDREGDALRASATQLNDWEVKNNKGLGVGVWNIDENSFKKELNNLKRLALKGIQNAGGDILQQDEQSLLDNVFNLDNLNVNPTNYYP